MSEKDVAYAPKIGDSISALDTPSMIVDLDIMESNISKLFALLSPTGVDVRPHLKTTKSPILAKRLFAAGARGGCVAKISEAEAMVAGGVTDLLITTEIVGPAKVARLISLFRQNRELRSVIDSFEGADAIEAALAKSGIDEPLKVLVDLNVGTHRTGIAPGEPALKLAKYIAGLKHLKLIGVQGYEGHAQHVHGRETRETDCKTSMQLLTSTADLLRQNGLDIQVVTCGGTGTAEFCANYPGVTEVQPGSFIFMDSDYRNAVGSYFTQSLTLLATAISKPESNRVVIDTGLKSLTTDSGFAEPKDLPGVTYEPLGDEHGSLKWQSGDGLKVGDRMEMIPSHIDPTINLHNTYYAHRKGVIEEIWPVAGRGCVQ